MHKAKDLTIDEAVRDPMIRLVNKADGVNPHAFEAMLRSLAAERAPAGKALPDFLEDSGSGRARRMHRAAKPFGEVSASW